MGTILFECRRQDTASNGIETEPISSCRSDQNMARSVLSLCEHLPDEQR